MSDLEDKDQSKGFKGLGSLGSRSPKSPAPPERQADEPALPPAWEEANTQRTAQPIQSQTATPQSHGWVIGLAILSAVSFLFVWASSQTSSDNAYSPHTAANVSPTVPENSPAEPPLGPAVTTPPTGSGLVLTSDQIRYCVYEDRRIKGAQSAVNNYDQSSVNTYNLMVEDYNSRCGHFRYQSGDLSPIQSEANEIQGQLEQEGRDRLSLDKNGQDASTDDAAAFAAATAAAEAAAATTVRIPNTSLGANGDSYADAEIPDAELPMGPQSSAANEGNVSPNTYETSFDCRKARSIPEYLICHDPLLSADDLELAQLYQEAKASVVDTAGLKDQMRVQWNYREKNCRDKRCLSDWYVSQKDFVRRAIQTKDINAN